MAVVCEEVFDETSHPSVDEIRDYASKIGIDPDTEPQLLSLAAEGLMKALPPGWKPIYDDKKQSYYYYNNLSGKTQWEHPLDDVYRGLVRKVRAESQSFSIGDANTEDATFGRDDELPSLDELVPMSKKLEESLGGGGAKKRLAPLKPISPKHESKLLKQHSEDHILANRKISLNIFNSFDNNEEKKTAMSSSMADFDRHPRNLDKTELKISGGGAMFLKSNTKKIVSESVSPSALAKSESTDVVGQPRSILRERNSIEVSKSMEFDKISIDNNRSERDDDDKKSVRFNLENTTDVAFTFSDKSSSSDDDDELMDNNIINVKISQTSTPKKSRLAALSSPVIDFQEIDDAPNKTTNLKLVKPNPTDFIKPKLTLSKGSDSEEDDDDSILKSTEKIHISDSDSESPMIDSKLQVERKKLQEKAQKRMAQLKQNLWEEKNDELLKYKDDLQESQTNELERILIDAKTEYETRIKTELENLQSEMENRNTGTLKKEKEKYDLKLKELNVKLEQNFVVEEKKLVDRFDMKREELEKYYDEKLAEIEKELAERMEKNRDELIMAHNSNFDQLKQNHSILIEELKKEFQHEEELLRKEHKSVMQEMRQKMSSESEKQQQQMQLNEDVNNVSVRHYEKMRCEKRLLEDKYRCLKEKYLRLKTEVKMSIEKRNNKRKEQGRGGATTTTTTTTGSETERSNSNNKDSQTPLNSPLRKPPTTPKHSRKNPINNNNNNDGKVKVENRTTRQLFIQDVDTSVSDKSDMVAATNEYDSSDNNSLHGGGAAAAAPPLLAGRSGRKKMFSKLKSSSTSRINSNNNNNNNNNHHKMRTIAATTTNSRNTLGQQRSCSPVENLRRQLQKLEDLEDQFPQNPQADGTYHLRYPFSGDGHQKFEGSSELEFFRHRIHLERDSIKRAKESLRSQKSLFQQRQKELKLKHGSMARHTFQQLCQEEKELTDMEVSLHRTRSLLGEKVIRLRHLEQSLQRATITNENRHDDATLSDISSHSASSGISSTEFATAPADVLYNKGLLHSEHLQESSEIIQSLENLNSEIREIWDVLRKQQQQSAVAGGLTTVIPPLVYPDLGWPLLAGAAAASSSVQSVAPPSIPTLADRLHNYRQHVALVNAQSTMVTHATNQQGATTTLVERTRNLRHWLRQAGVENNVEGAATQATL